MLDCQADTIMLSYPLGFNMSAEVLADDLSFYDGNTDPSEFVALLSPYSPVLDNVLTALTDTNDVYRWPGHDVESFCDWVAQPRNEYFEKPTLLYARVRQRESSV